MSDRRKARRARPAPPKTLAAVRPNAGTEARYRKRLQALIREMDASVQYWVRATYKANEPAIAQDELPAKALEKAMRKLAKRWQKQFDDLAPKLADHFTQVADKRSSLQLKSMLREHGFTVEFKMTDTMRDVMNASVAEQVSLIKSIPQKYFTDVQGSVMRSVQAGRDLSSLTEDLQENYGVSFRRAAFIARDQSNKMNATISRARKMEIGVTEEEWLHSGGGKTPRPTHVAMNGKRYDITTGMWDLAVGKFVFPGEEPNCRCVSKAVIPGFS